jgi:hypothetical protein
MAECEARLQDNRYGETRAKSARRSCAKPENLIAISLSTRSCLAEDTDEAIPFHNSYDRCAGWRGGRGSADR